MRPLEPGMDSLRPQMDHCRKGMDPLKLLIFLFSQSVDGGRRQLLIDAVENGYLGSERGMKFHPFHPFWVRYCHLVRQSFPLHLTKGQGTFLILKRLSRVSRGYTRTEGALRPARAHICREILTTRILSSVIGGFPMWEPSRLMVHPFRLSEDSLKIILDI